MRKIGLLLTISFLAINIYAQQRSIELAQTGLISDGYSANNAKVFINENPNLLNILMHHKKLNEDNLEIRGWRIRVFMGSGKDARAHANSVKLKIRNSYPQVEPHLVHHSPYFKILVGDFRTRIDAESFRKIIIRQYPNCYVVESEILIDNL